MRRRVWGALAIGLVAACGADAVAREVMGDAGSVLRDAGEVLLEAGTWLDAAQPLDAAQAAEPEAHDLACDHAYTRTETSGTTRFERTNHYAELVIEPDKVGAVDVKRCAREVLGTDPEACSSSSTCTGALRPSVTVCEFGADAELTATGVRVLCGSRVREFEGTTVTLDQGFRWKQVRLVLR